MSTRVFVSHASADQEFAQRLVSAVEAQGVKCWIAGRDVAAGANFQDEIVHAIQAAGAMIVIFSANANRSGEMRKELALASQQALTVIPLRLDDAKPQDAFAYELATRQWIDQAGDLASTVERLVARLRGLDTSSAATAPGTAAAGSAFTQKIAYCRAPDGVRLAYATAGAGPPLVKTANYLNHLEYDWESPVWRHLLQGLARDFTLLRYDARGNGLSDWDVDTLSLDAWVADLETVVDAAGIERFPLLGISQGCAVSVAYAVRHPERVSHLILYGGYALGGRKRSPEEKEKMDAMTTLIRHGWGENSPVFRQMFTSLFIPGATREQADFFNELQRRTTSAECAARYRQVTGDFDVRDLLPQVTAPTLVLHVRGDLVVPFESGRELAAGIPGSRFIAMQGDNHLFLEQDPAAQRFFEEVRLFLGS